MTLIRKNQIRKTRSGNPGYLPRIQADDRGLAVKQKGANTLEAMGIQTDKQLKGVYVSTTQQI
jgi:hypothetical protein